MNMERKTASLEIQVTGVQKDVSYLKEKVDKVDIKLDKMDSKTDKLMTDLPGVFREIMENYVTKDEFMSFKEIVEISMAEHKGFDKRISGVEFKWKMVTILGGILATLLTFGDTIANWLTSLVHHE